MLLAPISRLWAGVAPAEAPAVSSPPPEVAGLGKGRPTMTATKRTTSTGITSATVNVEFGGGGMSSRQKTVASASPLASTPEAVGGIFAGGGLRRPKSRWALVDRPTVETPTATATKSRSRDDHDAGHKDGGEGDFRTTLLERTLRPRGLSDSSIHSTFIQHGSTAYTNPTGRLVKPTAAPVASTTAHDARRSGMPALTGPVTSTPTASWVKPVRILSQSGGSGSASGSPAPYSLPRGLDSRRREGGH